MWLLEINFSYSLFGQPLPHSWTENIWVLLITSRVSSSFIGLTTLGLLFINHTPNPLSSGFLFGLLHGLIRRMQTNRDREEVIKEYELFITTHRISAFVMAPGLQAARVPAPAASANGPSTSSTPTPKLRDPKH